MDGAGLDRTSWSGIGLWGLAGAIVLSAHVGAAAWLMRDRSGEVADAAPPPAIMIELAPEAEAVMTEASEVTTDQETAKATEPDETAKTQETEEAPPPEPPAAEAVEPRQAQEVAPVEPEQPEPVEEIAEETDPVEEQITAQLDRADVPVPLPRPQPQREKPRKEREQSVERARPKQTTSSRSAAKAQAQVKQSDRDAAQQPSSGFFSTSMSPDRWKSRLMAYLDRRKRYPARARSRGEQGIAYVQFRVDAAGNVVSVALLRSSGFLDLDQEVIDLMHRASPVPAPPPGFDKTITAPIAFTVR